MTMMVKRLWQLLDPGALPIIMNDSDCGGHLDEDKEGDVLSNAGSGPLDVRDGGAHEPRVQPAPPLHVAPGHHRPEDEPHGAAAAAAERLPDISIIKYTRLQKPGPQLQESFVHQNLSCSNISSANKVVFEDRNI